MEEKVFVGYGYGRFKNDRGDMQEYCNVFMLEDFTGSESDDYHFGGQKAVKYRCLKQELFKDIAPGEVAVSPTWSPQARRPHCKMRDTCSCWNVVRQCRAVD